MSDSEFHLKMEIILLKQQVKSLKERIKYGITCGWVGLSATGWDIREWSKLNGRWRKRTRK